MPNADRTPRRDMAELVLHLENAGILLERLERRRTELTGPGELVGIGDLRRRFDHCIGLGRQVLAQFVQNDRVEGPARAGGNPAIQGTPSLSSAHGAPEPVVDHGWPELAEGQVWLACHDNARWRVTQLNPCKGEGPTALLRAITGPHAGATIVVRAGEIRDQGMLVDGGRA